MLLSFLVARIALLTIFTPKTMRIFSIVLALVVLFPAAAQAEELSNSPQFRYRSHRTRAISRPSHRSVERNTRAYRFSMAEHRRGFKTKLQRIESARDAIRSEYRRAEAPEYILDKQGFVPFHTYRYRRSVRRFHWNTHFQELPEADLGQGHGADIE